jgi:hypothetical protein
MTVSLEESGPGTRITLRQLYPTPEARDEVLNRYGAKEGGEQHLAKREAYLVDHPS